MMGQIGLSFGEAVTTSNPGLCAECGLFRRCKHPKMKPTGDGELQTLIVAEAPGAEEDLTGKQLVGEVGQHFRSKLKKYGLNLDRHFWKTNALICRPPDNRDPTKSEIKACQSNLQATIKRLNPRVIWLMGGSAIESMYLGRFKHLEPSRWRNLFIPDPKTGAYILPFFHPSFSKRNEGDSLIQSVYDRDLKQAVDFTLDVIGNNKPRPVLPDYEGQVRILLDYDTVITVLKRVLKNKYPVLFFDYETTGLKPFRAGHKIISISFCCYPDDPISYSFPFGYRNHWTQDQFQEIKKLWAAVLTSYSFKRAHNLKFEDIWSRQIVGVYPENWDMCTMTTAHVLDNRSYFTGLKFQGYIRYGIESYENEIEPYKQDIGNGFNRMESFPLKELLLYGGIDSFIGSRLGEDQIKELEEREGDLEKANSFFTDSLLTCADMQVNGIPADSKYYASAVLELTEEIKQKESKLKESDECKRFLRERGREINLSSDQDLRDLFFTILKLEPTKQTDKQQASVDASVLANMESGIAKGLIELSKLEKTLSTYIVQFFNEIDDDGKIHPFFDLHIPKTYRGSSSRPNAQNVPIRDEVAKRYSRSGIIPSKGNIILDWDYGAIEVKQGACYTKDPTLVAYCIDPTTDMHRDQSMDIYMLPISEIAKKIRFFGKNGFVFPEWYGSYYVSCAKNLWKDTLDLTTTSGVLIKDHLKSKGIVSLKDFTAHLKDVEERYWNKFHVFREWRDRWYADFEQTGVIRMFTGFECSGYLGRNELVNYTFQGTAFHCLLWSANHINQWLIKTGKKSRIIGQIHDCLLFDCFPPEKEEIKEMSEIIATQKIREEWDWIIVPLTIEWEETMPDQSWYSKKSLQENYDMI